MKLVCPVCGCEVVCRQEAVMCYPIVVMSPITGEIEYPYGEAEPDWNSQGRGLRGNQLTGPEFICSSCSHQFDRGDSPIAITDKLNFKKMTNLHCTVAIFWSDREYPLDSLMEKVKDGEAFITVRNLKFNVVDGEEHTDINLGDPIEFFKQLAQYREKQAKQVLGGLRNDQ